MKKHFIKSVLCMTATIGTITATQPEKLEEIAQTEPEMYVEIIPYAANSVMPEAEEKVVKIFVEPFHEIEKQTEETETVKETASRTTETAQEVQEVPQRSIYTDFTSWELDLLFRVVQAEIGDEWTMQNKMNVASVIFNRVESPLFLPTLIENLNGQEFSSISDGRYMQVEVSSITIAACEQAYLNRTNDCLFFDSNGAHHEKYVFIFHDGAHNFYSVQ